MKFLILPAATGTMRPRRFRQCQWGPRGWASSPTLQDGSALFSTTATMTICSSLRVALRRSASATRRRACAQISGNVSPPHATLARRRARGRNRCAVLDGAADVAFALPQPRRRSLA
jgi:hypothetical protein